MERIKTESGSIYHVDRDNMRARRFRPGETLGPMLPVDFLSPTMFGFCLVVRWAETGVTTRSSPIVAVETIQ